MTNDTDEDEKTLVRENLIRFREDAGMTPDQAASRAHMGASTLRAIENGTRSIPKAINLRRLCEVYGHDVGHAHMHTPPPPDRSRIAIFAVDVLDGFDVDDDLLEKARKLAAQLNAEHAARRAKKRH